MNISTEAIKNGVFLNALTEKEEIAYLLYLLAEIYKFKYHNYDTFTLICANQILRILPNNAHALYLKLQTLQQYGYDYINIIGKKYSFFIENVCQERNQALHLLQKLGFSTITIEEYINNLEQAYKQIGAAIPTELFNQIKSGS